MGLLSAQIVFAQNVAELLMYIHECKYGCTLGEAWRTPEMAAIYKAQGKGIVDSQHCKKLAIDINLFKDGKYLSDSKDHKPFGDFWESLHPLNRWGGDWDGDDCIDPGDNDGNHYEMRVPA